MHSLQIFSTPPFFGQGKRYMTNLGIIDGMCWFTDPNFNSRPIVPDGVQDFSDSNELFTH